VLKSIFYLSGFVLHAFLFALLLSVTIITIVVNKNDELFPYRNSDDVVALSSDKDEILIELVISYVGDDLLRKSVDHVHVHVRSARENNNN